MFYGSDRNVLMKKAVVMTAVLIIIPSLLAEGCKGCETWINRSEDELRTLLKRMPMKKDVFMSRGWGAGGTAYTSRGNQDLAKKTRIVEMLVDDEDKTGKYEEPRAHYLRAQGYVPRSSGSRRRFPIVVPQLFISSGWGPLGK